MRILHRLVGGAERVASRDLRGHRGERRLRRRHADQAVVHPLRLLARARRGGSHEREREQSRTREAPQAARDGDETIRRAASHAFLHGATRSEVTTAASTPARLDFVSGVTRSREFFALQTAPSAADRQRVRG